MYLDIHQLGRSVLYLDIHQLGRSVSAISVGAPRTLRFVNKSGKIKEVDVTLEHGSIFSMAAESQLDWSHSLTIENSVTEPRVSFTFRRLRELDDRLIPQHSPVPPIRPPEPVNLPSPTERITESYSSLTQYLRTRQNSYSTESAAKISTDALRRLTTSLQISSTSNPSSNTLTSW